MQMKNKKQRVVIITLIIISVLVLLGVGIIWFRPLFGGKLPESKTTFDPSMLETVTGSIEDAQDDPLQDTGSPENDDSVPGDPAEIAQAADLASEVITQEKEPLCNGPESLSVLVLGIDDQAQSDAIRLVNIDFVEPKILVLSIPRDFYLPIVDMAEHGITQGRINATYGYGEYFNGRGQGIISLSENLYYNFGVSFDHYFVLSFGNIAKYIDKIGGIQITLDKPVSDGNLYFSSGDHDLDGETAVGFMRMRYYDDDFARVRRQTLILKAFYKKVIGELSSLEISQMAFSVLLDKNIQTDFAIKDMTPLVCLARAIDSSDVHFVEIPSNMYRPATTSAGGAVQIPNELVVPFIQSVMDGTYEP